MFQGAPGLAQKEMATPPSRRLVELLAEESSLDRPAPRADSRATSSLQTDPNGFTPTTERSCAREIAILPESLERRAAAVARLWVTPRTSTATPVRVGRISTAARADQKRPWLPLIP